MTAFARLCTLFIALAAMAPVLAVNTSRTNGKTSCGSSEFWFSEKSCCLPHGGPPAKPTPPPGSDCPPTGWYWHKGQGCCVPSKPPPPSSPPPQCNKSWFWSPHEWKCCPNSQTTTSVPSHPSQTPTSGGGSNNGGSNNGGWNNGGHNGGWHKRAIKSRAPTLCPTGLEACPIKGSSSGEYECIETALELQSCGGCASLGEGQDCTAIPGAWNVGCEQGVCKVYTCAAGFKHSANGKSCIAA